MAKLNIDEVLALQMFGLSTSKILKTDLDVFNRLFDEHTEIGKWLEEINEKPDRQDGMPIRIGRGGCTVLRHGRFRRF